MNSNPTNTNRLRDKRPMMLPKQKKTKKMLDKASPITKHRK